MRLDASLRRRLWLQNQLFTLLFVLVIGLLAWLSTRYPLQADWTANGRNTLSVASQTLLAGERLAEALHKGGVPADIFQNLVLDHATTEALITERHFGFVNFTGSVGGGQAIERAAAGGFTGTGLELGGKDPGALLSVTAQPGKESLEQQISGLDATAAKAK